MLLKIVAVMSAFLFNSVMAVAADSAPTSAAPAPTGMAQELLHLAAVYFVKYSFQVLGGCIVLAVGWFLAQYVSRVVQKYIDARGVDITVSKFISGAVWVLIMALAAVLALSKFGIEIAPFIAGISVVGFGTSFALQGPLSNYASGATLIFTKPFKVGDIIEVAGVMGEVQDMKLSSTELKTVDGELVVIPNKHIIGEIIHNYSSSKRVDVTIPLSYRSSPEQAIRVLEHIVTTHPLICKDKPPKIGISEFTDVGINIYARFWCPQEHYWSARFEVNLKAIEAFKREGLDIPVIQKNIKEA